MCTGLREVLLPTTLHALRVKAFMNCAALVELAIPPSLRYIGSGVFPDCTVFSGLVKMPERHKWRSLCRRECFRHLSCCAMATLAAHDPGHGAHSWSWMKTRLFLGGSERCIAVTLLRSGHAPLRESKVGQRSRQGKLHGEGRNIAIAPLYGKSTQEYHGEAGGKQKKMNCTLPKTSVPEQTG